MEALLRTDSLLANIKSVLDVFIILNYGCHFMKLRPILITYLKMELRFILDR